MKKYVRTMVANYLMNGMNIVRHVGSENAPAEMLKKNSYTMLNVSPRFF